MRRALAFALVFAVTATAAAAPKKKKRKSKKHARKAKVTEVRKQRDRDAIEKWIDHPGDADAAPAVKYGALTKDACEAELARRKISFVREEARGVMAPVRLTGPLHGVTFRTNLPDKQRATSHWEIGDCRLILALDDFAALLAKHDIVEVRHYSMYRPAPDDWPADKPTVRHNAAVALDAGKFIAADGTVYDVDADFNGRLGAKTCGDGAKPDPVTPKATLLRTIVCEAVEARLFNVVLTPNYNKPHHNHFHLEVTEGARWFLVH
ncbi:MAG TPA: extensin family protein [Kofleriaceae bacterium]|nr:extensin family protein [Kofleriaceae bacterium]